MTVSSELVFRLVHIFCGVFWAGAAIMLAGFIEPTVKSMGPEGGKFVQRLMGPGRFGVYMSVASLLVVLSGLALLWNGSGAHLGAWLTTNYGRTIILGSVAGLMASGVGFGVNAPTAGKIARLAREMQSAGGPPDPERLSKIQALQHRLHRAGIASAVLLTVSVVAMAIARAL